MAAVVKGKPCARPDRRDALQDLSLVVAGHGTDFQHNETVVPDDDDVAAHGYEQQHNETTIPDDDVAAHGTEQQHNETVVPDDDEDAGPGLYSETDGDGDGPR